MGISFQMIQKMQELKLMPEKHTAVLDIGSSNLYSASKDEILQFLSSRGITKTTQLSSFAERLATDSLYDHGGNSKNTSFVGELFEKAGFKYDAIDIADGYKTTILDLNHESAPTDFVGAYDLVLNFGTTEHLLNQYNAFKVIHDATKVGGYIVNQLPSVGFSDHGYFTYTPRCMFDMAGYNNYEVAGFWFEGPAGENDLYAPLKNYLTYFPNLSQPISEKEVTEQGKLISELHLPDIAITIIYKKVKEKAFLGALERSTSVGDVPSLISEGYAQEQKRIQVKNRPVNLSSYLVNLLKKAKTKVTKKNK
mgnify:CR=1 FL=1